MHMPGATRIVIGSVVLSLLAAVGVGVWALAPGGDQAGGAVVQSNAIGDAPFEQISNQGVRGIVTYRVVDASGILIESGQFHNTVNDEGKNETFNRIAGTATGGSFDGIAAMDVPVGTDDPADGVDSTSITLNLDGDSGTGGEQNPADGNVTTDFGTETGNGTVDVTFTATSDSTSIFQIVLTKSVEDDTLVGGALAIGDADIFAYVDVPDITLNTSDTVQYTWTVDVD